VLPAVRVELLEPVLQAFREPTCRAAGIGEHEHPDRASLAIARRGELDRGRASCLTAKHAQDPLEPAVRLRSQERERDVQRLRRPAPARQFLASPAPKRRLDVVWQLEGEEEAESSIRLDGSGFAHLGV
jgi:hypothetical protein